MYVHMRTEDENMLLNLIFWVTAILASLGIWLGIGSFSAWWLLLLIPGCYIGSIFLYFFCIAVSSLFMPIKESKKSSPFCRFLIGFSMEWLMHVMGIRVKLTGTEQIPEQPCVFVSNHRSDFDPMTLLAVFRNRKLVYISKKENFKIPVVGPFICHAGFLAIDRENGMRALRTLKNAAERMKTEALDVGIYPEGTRSRTGKLLRFKSGAFYLAKEANAPIVILTTRGTERVSKRFLLAPLTVHLDVVDVIDAQAVASLTVDELAARSRAVVEAKLAEFEGTGAKIGTEEEA